MGTFMHTLLLTYIYLELILVQQGKWKCNTSKNRRYKISSMLTQLRITHWLLPMATTKAGLSLLKGPALKQVRLLLKLWVRADLLFLWLFPHNQTLIACCWTSQLTSPQAPRENSNTYTLPFLSSQLSHLQPRLLACADWISLFLCTCELLLKTRNCNSLEMVFRGAASHLPQIPTCSPSSVPGSSCFTDCTANVVHWCFFHCSDKSTL